MYPIDDLANIVAMANEAEQLALTEDIKVNGQREPAVLWQGRIVDGRCRQLACHSLGIELVTRELDGELPREDVALIVKSLNTRRNLTETQKAMSAFKAQQKNGLHNEAIATRWGISLGSYKNAKYLGVNRPELVTPLFDGKSVTVFDPDKGYEITTNKINTLARIVKKTKEANKVMTDDSEVIEFSADGKIKTEVGKSWYYGFIAEHNISNVYVKMALVELANLKYKLKED